MRVTVHPDLSDFLGRDEEAFVERFKEWKANGEYSSYYFGKDGGYEAPKLDWPGHYLMHVHLVPIIDLDDLEDWEKAWGGHEGSRGKRKGRKTSDRVLVYVGAGASDYLLITIMGEEDAPHEVAKMKTPADRNVMYYFAAIADHFIETGKVLE